MIKRENEEEERDNFNNNNNNEKRTTNFAFKRTRIWTYRWIYERFVSYEPLCFKRVIFVQNERKKLERRREKLNFFWKKTWDFYSFPLLGQQFCSRGLEEKKMKAMAQKRSTPPLLVCWLFLQKKIRGLARSKRRKKTSVWLFPLLYITRESGTIINYRALRFVLRII